MKMIIWMTRMKSKKPDVADSAAEKQFRWMTKRADTGAEPR